MKIKKFDVVDFLDNDEAIIEYLNTALEEGNSEFFVKAVGDVARSKGMMKVARSSGLGRQNLYRSLSRGGNPRIETLFRVLDALDIKLSVAR
ncbi:MAG: putative addiction module antidote protein [Gammaproteobacteria bacterium]|nr:putative addiction module antidote protein [Gammaproteobacteria bacterium]